MTEKILVEDKESQIPTKEELAVYMTKVNERLESIQERQEELTIEIGELFEELGNTLRPIIRDYYGMDDL